MLEGQLRIYRTNPENGYKVDFDYYYRLSRLHTDWANPTSDIASKLKFLKQFRCQGFSYDIIQQITDVLQEVEPLFIQIEDIAIQDLNEREDVLPIISNIFDRLRGPIKGFKETATSKFMHMTCPNLLVMADSVIASCMQNRNIIRHYFLVSEDYIRLLRFYCNEVNELIADIQRNNNINRLDAVAHLINKDMFSIGSIPRIIDKHFYHLSR